MNSDFFSWRPKSLLIDPIFFMVAVSSNSAFPEVAQRTCWVFILTCSAKKKS